MTAAVAQGRTDTRGFVISGLYTATHPHRQNCRSGAKSPAQVEEFVLLGMGYSRAEVSYIRLHNKDRSGTPRRQILQRRGINGTEVEAGADPARTVDPGFELMNGPYAPGFDLDGNPQTGFTDPYTGRKGVDNQVLRALGCFGTWDVSWPVKPFTDEIAWDVMLDTLPAWLISVSGKDLQQDGEVEVTFANATQHTRRNASGGTLADSTFVIQPGSRSRGKFRGRIRDGVMTLDAGQLELEGEVPFFPVLRLQQARAYFRLMPDGSLDGFIGGYQPWIDIVYYAAANAGLQADTAGIYHNLRKTADAGRDPKTGANTLISVAYRVQAVPAFLATLERKVIARSGGIPRSGLPLRPVVESAPQARAAPQGAAAAGVATRRLTNPAADPLVERGRVLALAGNCYSCHTADTRKPFAGGVAFYTDFGTIHSTNISTDRRSGIGAWTEAEFERAMRRGIGRDGQHLYPAFPYTSFTKLTDRDVKALYAFLRSVEPVAFAPPRNRLKFPLNSRRSLAGWKMLFFEEGRFEPTAGLTRQQARGEYLTEALAHCGACHTPRNVLGAEQRQLAYAGGVIYHRVASGDVRAWGTPNLTADATGLGSWSAQELYDYLKFGHSGRAVLMGPMNDVVLNSTRHLPELELRAMVAYLKALPARSVDSGRRADAAQMRRGELLYVANCGSCHTLNGTGDPKTAPSLQRSAQVQAPDPASLLNIILYGPDVSSGLTLPVSRPDMPPFAAKLDDQAIADLATFLRNSFGNRAGAVTSGQVARQR